MNISDLMLFFIVTCLLFCCGNGDGGDDSNPKSECTEAVSFIEDGNEVTLAVGGLGEGAKAVFQFKDPSPFDSKGVSRAFGLKLQSGLSSFDIVLELNVDDAESCIPTGVYDLNTLDSSDGLLSFGYIKGFEFYIAGLGEGSGVLEITKCDFENKLISGKFSCTVKKGLNPESIVITEGEFEDVCWVE